MGYREWFEQHGKKHAAIMAKLTHLNDEEVIAYFSYDNMKEKEPDFCPLYKKERKCHDMEDLNCYLCACPHFRFDDEGFEIREGKPLKSYCSIDAKEGKFSEGKDAIHQNCSSCHIPHKKSYIKKHFDRDWFHIMKDIYDIKKD